MKFRNRHRSTNRSVKHDGFAVTFGILVIMSGLFNLQSCAVNPVTGKRQLMLVSTAQEEGIGKETDAQVLAQYGVYEDEEMQKYLEEVGRKLVPFSHRPELNYTFKVVDSDILNAFAVPGGYVYFTRGIMAHFNSEAEMAGVMGHELGHIAARHTAQQITKSQIAQIGLGVGAIVSDTFRKYADLADFGVGLLFLKFSRDHENQSDELGVEYSTKAGYDANQMADFFYTLERMRPPDGSGIPSFLSTHPEPGDRVVHVRSLTSEWQAKYPGKSFSANRETYLNRIDGIVYGPDPRQGFVENNVFYHPALRFSFPTPDNWTVNNLPTQVQIFPESQDAALLFSLAKQSDPGAAALAFVENSGARVVQNTGIQVNGMTATRLVTAITSDQSDLSVLSYFILKDNQVYTFHGLTAQKDYSEYRGILEASMSGFDHLRDPKILNIQPKRVRLRQVKISDNLSNTLALMDFDAETQEKIALLNGMLLTDDVAGGTLIKVISDR